MKKIILFLCIILLAINAYTAYLRNIPIELKQPDGTVISCFVTGDEFHRRVHDKDNYTIVPNPHTGFYVYAQKSGDELIPSENVVGNSDPIKLGIEPNLDIPVSQMEEKRDVMLKSVNITTNSPNKGNFYNLVVFVRFADDDDEFTEKSESFNSLYNDLDPDANSVFGFYNKSSGGQLKVYSKFYPTTQNENVISYKDQYNRNYYSSYNISNPIGYKNNNERSEREHSLMKNALNSIKASIPSSEIIDGNNDGYIDNVSIIIKGSFDYWGDLLWPHMSYSNSHDVSINDKSVAAYNIQIEEFIVSEGVRVLCHELFHSLGAPDLYRYGDKNIDPVGSWDIMGSYDGQHLTAYMKWKYGKWFDNLPEITQPGTYTLQSISKNPFSCYKIPSPNSNTEYFIAEYRERVGLIIYRINTLAQGNAGGPPDEIYVFRPSGTLNFDGLLFEAAFSKQNNRVLFNSESNPSCFLSNGQSGQIDISNIGSAENEISININTFNPIPQPRNLMGELKQNQVVFNWNSPKKKGYLLLGYNIFIGESEVPLNNTIITDTTYTFARPDKEENYLYKLTANYIEGTSSPISTSILNVQYNIGDKKWINYTSSNIIYDVAQEGDYLWLAGGGLDKFNMKTGENQNFNHANSGLPANDVKAVGVDKLGNKWIGMESGDLVKFDGKTWTTFIPPLCPYSQINAIVVDSKNLIWIATQGTGLYSFDGNNWKFYNTSNSELTDDQVWCINVDSQDNIWVGMSENLAKFNGTNWTIYNSDNWKITDTNNSDLSGGAVCSIVFDKTGNKWIGTTKGDLIKFDDHSWIRTRLANGMYVSEIAIDDHDNKWVGGTNCYKLYKVDDIGFKTYDRPGGILSILIDQNNNKWVGTFGDGLMKFDGNNWMQHKTGNSGLTYDRIWSIYLDKNGTKWIGTEQKGAVSFNGDNWTAYEMSNPFYSKLPGVHRITGDDNGNVWYATEYGVAKYDGNNFEYYNHRNSPIPNCPVYTILIDKKGVKWFGTENGLVAYNGTNWKIYNSSNLNLLSNQISAITIDKKNNLWIGYRNIGGISKFNGTSCETFAIGINGPGSQSTQDLFIDNEENLWVLGRYGDVASKYNGFSWSHYQNLAGVSTVRQDRNNQLWFGGYYRGLITLKNSQWITYNVDNSGIPSNMVTTLEIDSLGNKWIGTYGAGLAVFNENGVVQPPIAKAGIAQTINEREFVTLDGSSSYDPDGTLLTYKWIAPAGITLSSTTIDNPTFIAPEVKKDSVISFSLIVNDGKVSSAPATVKITVLNVIKVGNSEISSPVFKVYPNPTTGMITLEFKQNSGNKAVVSVSNLIGAEVFRKEFEVAEKFEVDLSNQVSGIYLLKVIVDNRQYISKIVIKKG